MRTTDYIPREEEKLVESVVLLGVVVCFMLCTYFFFLSMYFTLFI